MKSIIHKLTLCALLGSSMSAHAAQVSFPNGDFSAPDGLNWGKASDGAQVFNFPTSGGNTGGFGEIVSSTTAGYAVLISNNDAPYPLSSLGLVAGNTYTFSYDMRASVAGPNKGGIKVESWSATARISDSTNQRVTAASTGWATYSYNYKIAATATHIKLVPLWTPNETVGFDNFRVNNTPVPPTPVVPDQIPNGDFSVANGASWTTETTGPVITFPSTDGNPNGNAIIDASVTEGFAAIEAFSGAQKTWTSLGLAPGDTFTVQMDMKILAGSNLGGVRLVGGEGFVRLVRPALIGDGSTWQTYSIPFTVPTSPLDAKFTFVWGFNSKVAFDNIKIVLPGAPRPLQATITAGTILSWTAASAVNGYQPQTSSNGTTWTNLGPIIVGNTASSIFDTPKAKFYQVLESTPVAGEAAYNGGFETDFIDPEVADGWEFPPGQRSIRITTAGAARTGEACMQLKVDTGVTTTPQDSQTSQNVRNAGNAEIVVGSNYTLSFWYKQISKNGDGYVQEFRVSWLGLDGIEIPVGGGKWQKLPSTVTGNYVQQTLSGLVAPTGALSAFIQITAKTGATAGEFGEVLIDDVSLASAGFESPVLIPSTSTASVEISWPSKTGKSYQVQSSDSLGSWSNFGGVITGNGSLKAVYDGMAIPKNFYRVGELP